VGGLRLLVSAHCCKGVCVPCVVTVALPLEKTSYYSSLSNYHSLCGNTRKGAGKKGGSCQNWTEKKQPSVFVELDKVLLCVHSIQNFDGQECV